MGVRKRKPVTPTTRHTTISDFSEITRSNPEKSLTKSLRKTGGRNNYGRKTVTTKGGGHKRRYRVIDFTYTKKGASGVVASIEYDPNRSARIALVSYKDGDKTYVIAPDGLRVGTTVPVSYTHLTLPTN